MPRTANQVINRAAKICGVLSVGQTLSAEDQADFLDTLNGLLQSVHGAGVVLPDYSVASGQTNLSIKDEDYLALCYNLGLIMAPEYGREISDTHKRLAKTLWDSMLLRYVPIPETIGSNLPVFGGRG